MSTAATTTHARTWTYLVKPTSDGHRYFRSDDGRIALADNSGSNPDHTDDGPLYLDVSRERRVRLCLGKSYIECWIPVVRGDGGHSQTCASGVADLAWLLRNGHVDLQDVKMDAKLRDSLTVLTAVASVRALDDVAMHRVHDFGEPQ